LLPSLFGSGSAVYHNFVAPEHKIPTTDSSKEEIQIWLRKENIEFNDNCLKPELLTLVRKEEK